MSPTVNIDKSSMLTPYIFTDIMEQKKNGHVSSLFNPTNPKSSKALDLLMFNKKYIYF